MKKSLSVIISFVFLLLLVACGEKTPSLVAPNVTLTNNVVTWNEVENASGYVVSKNDVEQPEQTTTAYKITETKIGSYEIKVKAISNDKTKYADSKYSLSVTYVIKEEIVKGEATLYVVGDSTLSSFTDTTYFYPRYGYGTQLDTYFSSKLDINNLALSGRSSKSFTKESNYSVLKSSISSGDYLLIGFGHNDEKSDDASRFTDASKPVTDSTSFKYSLYENYIKLAESRGATPILCTPIVRVEKGDYTGSSAHITSHGDYAEAIRELGQEKNVTVIDLTSLTKEKYLSIGYNEAIYYHAMTAGKYDTDNTTIIADTNSVDSTHLNIYGAKMVAYLFADAIKNTSSSLANFVLADITEPTRANDLEKNPNYTISEYKSPNLTSYQPGSQFTTITPGWYGTAFGDCGGTPTSTSNGYCAKETSSGVFQVGQTSSTAKGKFSNSSDGFAFLFQQIDINKNFEITATAKVITSANTKQSGFGLMLRDDCYINQNTKNITVTSNFVAAGFLTADTSTNVLFSRTNASSITKEDNVINKLYAVDDTATFKIIRLGQLITTEVVYNGKTYTKEYLDFDLIPVDSNYMYIGMFATRGTVVEFTDVNLSITGISQGA